MNYLYIHQYIIHSLGLQIYTTCLSFTFAGPWERFHDWGCWVNAANPGKSRWVRSGGLRHISSRQQKFFSGHFHYDGVGLPSAYNNRPLWWKKNSYWAGGGGGGGLRHIFSGIKRNWKNISFILSVGVLSAHMTDLCVEKYKTKKVGGNRRGNKTVPKQGCCSSTDKQKYMKKSKKNRSSHQNDSLFSPFYNRFWGSSKLPGGAAAPPAPPAPRGLHLCMCYTASFLFDYFADMLDHRGGSRIFI